MTNWDNTARLLWALGVACLFTAGAYGLQSLMTGFPPQPHFAPIGVTLLIGHGLYEWSRSRKETRK